jgi:hypothetical protein
MMTRKGMTMTRKYSVTYPKYPGNCPATHHFVSTLTEARRIASEQSHRRDLTYQDVVIFDEAKGCRVEFAGPSR